MDSGKGKFFQLAESRVVHLLSTWHHRRNGLRCKTTLTHGQELTLWPGIQRLEQIGKLLRKSSGEKRCGCSSQNGTECEDIYVSGKSVPGGNHFLGDPQSSGRQGNSFFRCQPLFPTPLEPTSWIQVQHGDSSWRIWLLLYWMPNLLEPEADAEPPYDNIYPKSSWLPSDR